MLSTIMFALFHNPKRGVYTISIAAELIGCHPRTLRIYEEEGLVEPKRTQGNYRLYSQEDLDRVRKIVNLMHELSLNLAGVKALFAAADKFHIEIEKMIDEMLSSVKAK